ncbi:MAG TPA: hypothetical protein VNP98_06475 [Chthoniobacterales bacterium]|nr:hypothetical protein [Chthoniobacterales bacterium]
MIIESVVAIGGTILAAYIWENHIRDRVSVRRIISPDDPDSEMLVDLYQNLFPDDGTNYSPAEILEFLDGSLEFEENRHVQAKNIVLIAKYRGDVVGFILCHFYRERRKAIVSYYGINREILQARRSAGARLLPRLIRILRDRRHPCDFLLFDLQGVDPTTPKKEAGERKARPVRFKQTARRLGLTAYLLQFQYLCPKISLSDGTHEYPFTLMCVPITGHLPKPVPRALVLEFLHFLHHDCYGDLYPVTDERFQPYHDHLRQRLKYYEDTLPPEVHAV